MPFIVAACIFVVPIVGYFLWVLVSDKSTPAKRVLSGVIKVVVAVVVVAVIGVCVYSMIPKEPTNEEKFFELYDEVGPDGILDYLQEHIDRDEIMFILYPELR